MKFKGLFIGIDRHSSADVPWLSCAKRDATALEALFADSFEGETQLLVDGQATKAALEEQFAKLAKSDPDDIVFIAFSGHGSETHELVCYDADLRDLGGTCIALDEIAEWFAKIPCRNLILILDCCFSGGIGSKVLQVPTKSRDLRSVNLRLEALGGEGRLILTASSAQEEAWENSQIGHGLLTHFLLEALQGAEEVRDVDRISIYKLLDYVTKRVVSSANELGVSQNPTLRGRLDGSLTWPILKAGAKYKAAFPEKHRKPASEEIHSLAPYGFPSELLEALSAFVPSLNSLQIRAINEFNVLDGEHLLVSAPTSSGKTMIGELAALHGVIDRKRCLFLLPLKALVNDKQRQFQAAYGPYGIRTVQATGESAVDDISALLKGQFDICLMTYEKFASMVLAFPHLLNSVGTVVVDEVQMIADKSRGQNLEFLMTLLRVKRRQGIRPQVIALSAVIGDTNGFEEWLGGRLLLETARPVPLDEGLVLANGTFRYVQSESQEELRQESFITPEYRKGSSQDWIVPIVRKLTQEGKQVIVFRETKGEARGCANYLSASLNLPSASEVIARLPIGDPSDASQVLRTSLAGGVAFHVADLDRDERMVVEEEFRKPNSQIRVIAATTTLAMGVNTPAEAVIIAGLMHPGDVPYSVAEYKNMVGRAGRLGYADRGASYLISTSPNEEHYHWRQYISGCPESISSRFLGAETDPRSLILRVLAAAQSTNAKGMTGSDIVAFLEESFGAYVHARKFGHQAFEEQSLMNGLRDLEQNSFVANQADGTYRLTELGRLAGEGGVQVESMLKVVRALQGLGAAEMTDPTLIALCQLTLELDDVYFPMNKKSTLKEPAEWFGQLSRQGIADQVARSLKYSGGLVHEPTLRAKKAVAALMWMSEMPMQTIEKTVGQFGGSFGGAAGSIRAVANRTADLLQTVARITEVIVPELELGDRVARLLARLECGASHVHADICLHIGTRLSRSDYQGLASANLNCAEDLEAASDEVLLSLLSASETKLKHLREGLKQVRIRGEVAEISEIPLYQA